MFLLVMASNTNATKPAIEECWKSLMRAAVAVFASGAQQSPGLLLNRPRKRRLEGERISGSHGNPMLPSSATEQDHLGFLFSAMGLISRQVGLLNKTAQSTWEISPMVLDVLEWFKDIVLRERLSCFFGMTLGQNWDRFMKGFVSRAVASCHMATMTSCVEQAATAKDGLLAGVLEMESSALTLSWAGVALLNGLSHLVDFGLCAVNQLIRQKKDLPVVSVDFLCQALDEEGAALDEGSRDWVVLRAFLEGLRAARENGGFTGSYVKVGGLGSYRDYAEVEEYLQRYCGVNQGSAFTYTRMFKDSANKVLDLTDFLCLPTTMLDVRVLFRRMGVRYDDSWYTVPGDAAHIGTRYLVLVPDPADKNGTSGVGMVWAHVVQHLLVSALIGESHLHADNSLSLGKALYRLVMERCAPQAAIPGGALLCESFVYRRGEVAESVVQVRCRGDYFKRARKDFLPLEAGRLTELGKKIGNHPPEDVIHLHARHQLEIMHTGKNPSEFYALEMLVGRSPELVPGRIYPVAGPDGERGTVCVCPGGLAFTLLKVEGENGQALPVERWQFKLTERGLSVAPLIFRRHAVVDLGGCVGVVVGTEGPQLGALAALDGWSEVYNRQIREPEGRGYLDWEGQYLVRSERSEELHLMRWEEVHGGLLALGTRVLVGRRLLGARAVPGDHYSMVMGWVRYPEEFDEACGEEQVAVAFRVGAAKGEFTELWVKGVDADECMVWTEGQNEERYEDWVLPAASG
jgi:hypothetical protein